MSEAPQDVLGAVFDADEIEAARVLFARDCAFTMGAVSMDGLPAP